MNRRASLKAFLCLAGTMAMLPYSRSAFAFAVTKTKDEWRALLPGRSYVVLFQGATEHPGRSPLLKEKRAGTYICLACHQPLFRSAMKYESGSGWPSFFDVLAGAVGTKPDHRNFVPRTEYHCSRCGGHHGHLFKDGPRPTGLRYCNNGVALRFVPANEPLPALRT